MNVAIESVGGGHTGESLDADEALVMGLSSLDKAF